METQITNESLASIVESIISGVCVFALSDKRDIIPVYLNEGFYRMLGYSHKDLDRMLKNVKRNIIPEDMPIFEQGIDDILKDDGAVEFEFRTVTGDGSIRWLQVRGNLYGKMDGYPLLVGIILDITERKSIEEELALQAERINILSDSVQEHLIDYNSRTDVMVIMPNKSAYKNKEIVIKAFMESHEFTETHPDDIERLVNVLTSARKSSLSDTVEFRSNFFDGNGNDFYWYKATITSVRGADGYVSRVVGRIVNIDEQKKRELELIVKADRDALTGLFNKGATHTLVAEALDSCKANNQTAALMMVDLDHFKEVNDTFGHSIGDKVLEDVGKVLSDTFKGRDVVGRMGGDEFVVFMTNLRTSDDAVNMCEKLNQELTKTISTSQGTVTVTASIGIAICDKDSGDFKEMFDKADQALYVTKQSGRNGRTLYSSSNMVTLR